MTRRLGRLASAALLLAALTSAGCSHGKPAPTAPALTKADLRYTSVYLADFTIAPAGVAETVPAPHVATARSACLSALTRSALFDAVKPAGANDPKQGALLVKAELVSLRIVGGGARFWLGAMAGKSDMKFQVTLVDAATGAVVAQSAVSENTNAWGGAWTMGGTDRSLPARVGEQLAQYVAFGARR